MKHHQASKMSTHGGDDDDDDYDSDDLYINYNHPSKNDQASNMSHDIMEISSHQINTRSNEWCLFLGCWLAQ